VAVVSAEHECPVCGLGHEQGPGVVCKLCAAVGYVADGDVATRRSWRDRRRAAEALAVGLAAMLEQRTRERDALQSALLIAAGTTREWLGDAQYAEYVECLRQTRDQMAATKGSEP
jgi:hypothetical protein